MDRYGTVKKVRVVKDKKGASRGYGFVEFTEDRELKGRFVLLFSFVIPVCCSFDSPLCLTESVRAADGAKILGRRILVDVERGRTVKGWKPRRLGQFVSLSSLYLAYRNVKCSFPL